MSDSKNNKPFSWLYTKKNDGNHQVKDEFFYQRRAEQLTQICQEVEEEKMRRVAEMESELASLQTAIANTKAELLDKQALMARQRDIEASLELLRTREASIGERERELERHQVELSVRSEALAEKSDALETKTKALDESYENLANRERTLQQAQEELSSKDKSLSIKEQTIEEKTLALEAIQQRVEQMKLDYESVSKRETELQRNQVELSVRSEALTEKSEALDTKSKALDASYEALTKQERALQQAQEDLIEKQKALELKEHTIEEKAQELAVTQKLVDQMKHDLEGVDEKMLSDAKAKQEELRNLLNFDLERARASGMAEIEAELAQKKEACEADLTEIRTKLTQEKAALEAAQQALTHSQARFTEEKQAWESLRDEENKALLIAQQRFEGLEQRETALREKEVVIQELEETLALEKRKIDVALKEVESDFKVKRNIFESQLLEDKQKAVADNEDHRAEHLAKLDEELDERRRVFMAQLEVKNTKAQEDLKRAEEQFEAALALRKAEWETKQKALQDSWTKEYRTKEAALEEQRIALDREKGKLESQKRDLETKFGELDESRALLKEQQELFNRRAKDREDNLSAEAEEMAEDFKITLDAQKTRLLEEVDRLRSELVTQDQLLSGYKDLQRRLGDRDPSEVIRDLNLKTDEIRRLREELSTRPTEDIRERIETLQRQGDEKDLLIRKLNAELLAKERPAEEIASLTREIALLKAAKESAEHTANAYKETQAIIEMELTKVRKDFEALYGSPAELEVRCKQVEKPYIEYRGELIEYAHPKEMDWLNGIHQSCENYGLHFNKRLLMAFHTALKTAEWAPLTVLAGVSGTGKSELPRLYSHFGGFYFCPVAVQPNWDSQESMLGYFNSIENNFDATPLLNFLAQTQKPEQDGYPGLADAMNLVLLDEMNLAHPELYFAEFLSKLELRRGMPMEKVPALQVKLGSGMSPYKLPLRRNVLWIGTMNQDETTKSLSDKVLDRSIIINFPRPTQLKRRPSLKSLSEDNRGKILPKECWGNWIKMSSEFTEEAIAPYKQFVESMNKCLGSVGRALGHRVWQSVEYYMTNHPLVLAAVDNTEREKAMHLAFEDQLVQKIMPKIRGVETRGRAKTECLDKIRNLLVSGVNGQAFNLQDDFDLSCELGYGQFIWQSANYLHEADSDKEE